MSWYKNFESDDEDDGGLSKKFSKMKTPSTSLFDLDEDDEVPVVKVSSDSSSSDDNRKMCEYGSNCYRKNPDHWAKYYHPHLSKKGLKKKVPTAQKHKVCPFLENGWCHKWSHVKFPSKYYKHPSKLIRCPHLDTKDKKTGKYVGCTIDECENQHPNPANTAHQASWKDDTPEKKKVNCFYLCAVPNMTNSVCVPFATTGACSDVNCTSQHLPAKQLPTVPLPTVPANAVAQVVQAQPGAEFFVKRIWTAQQSSAANSVVSVDEIISPKLYADYRTRYRELEDSGIDPDEIYGFHGTSKAGLQAIIQSGFRTDMQINNAYGKGTYFARDPIVSVGYSKPKGCDQMLLCRLILGRDKVDSIWAPSCCYYIIPDTRGCLPLYVITFK
jgi:hypothetical protein